jgi:6,7-dimethyl-8-ribityllumazine synthase
VTTITGDSDGAGLRIAVAKAQYNRPVTDGLLEGALQTLDKAGVTDVTVVEVPGAFDLPLIVRQLAESGNDAVVAIGAVVEGETDHYEHVAHRASEGLMQVMLETGVPVTYGVLAVRDPAHARARSANDDHNKGAEAAEAAVALANLMKELSSRVGKK